MLPPIPDGWRIALRAATSTPSWRELERFVDAERRTGTVYPHEREVFRALELTPLRRVSVLILGQDPYPNPDQAHGLAFSVRPGIAPPRSLRNIFRELQSDVGCPPPANGSLEPWAKQGVLLLNAVLTVRAGKPNSHKGKGWELFTDEVIVRVAAKKTPVVFVLWGAAAQAKAELITQGHHTILAAPHPSPLSAKRGFFGSRPFSKANAFLEAAGREPIDWCLPGEPT